MAYSLEEKDLLQCARRREPDAFSALYLKYQPSVLRHAYYLARNHQEAEDICAETFLRAWNAIERFEDRGYSLLSWLLKIAYNLRTQSLRRRPVTSGLEDLTFIVDADPNRSPELVAEAEMIAPSLRQALLDLPQIQRHVVSLRVLDGLSYEEIGHVVGKSEGAVRVIQHRALRTLQRRLGDGEFVQLSRRVGAEPAAPRPGRLQVLLGK